MAPNEHYEPDICPIHPRPESYEDYVLVEQDDGQNLMYSKDGSARAWIESDTTVEITQ